jgi:hypothetical protein
VGTPTTARTTLRFGVGSDADDGEDDTTISM